MNNIPDQFGKHTFNCRTICILNIYIYIYIYNIESSIPGLDIRVIDGRIRL